MAIEAILGDDFSDFGVRCGGLDLVAAQAMLRHPVRWWRDAGLYSRQRWACRGVPNRAHHGWSTLSQYQYAQKKDSKRGRAQTFWMTTGLAVLLAGGLVVPELGETDAERKARAKRDQEDYRNAFCKQAKKECAEAQEELEMRKQSCRYFGENCGPK